jgi:trimeric autotransporter adhesin
MNRIYQLAVILIAILLISSGLYAQSIERKVINAAGGHLTPSGGLKLTYNLGETFVTTISDGGSMLTQGFLQPIVVATSPITGSLNVCVGDTTTLDDSLAGGTWSSASPSIATIGSTGIVTGVAAGTAVISYTTSGGTVTAIVTVNPLPNAGTITGASLIGVGVSSTLSASVSGGTWSSSAVGVASVGSTGIVSGISAGSTTISYSVTNSCGTAVAAKVITVINDTLASRAWATYYGGSSYDVGISVATDFAKNIYISGRTTSTAGMATSGAYQTTLDGSGDAFLVKFNSAGVRQWATYYGGSGDEQGYSIATDRSGNVYLSGQTFSSSGIATSGAYQIAHGGGGGDAFVVKFDSLGARQWATYFGGAGMEYSYVLATDLSGNVFLSGASASNSGIASSGAHQTTYAGGTNDAFLAKFNSAGSLQWSTYYGSSSDEFGYSTATDTSGNVFLAGYTSGATGLATSGAHQTASGGGIDGFLVKFNSAGVRQWATYYGGSGYDYCNSTAVDVFGNVYLTGPTESSSGMVSGSGYQLTPGGGLDAYLAKFNSSGVRQWGTYYGGSGTEQGYSVATDIHANVYLTGQTNSTTGIASSGAFQPTFAGTSDVFLVKFNSSGSRRWGTYYGSSGNEYGSSVATDTSGNILVTGLTNSTSGIASSTAHQPTFGGSTYDAFLVRFSALSSITGSNSICEGATVSLSNATTGGTWSSGNTSIATVGSTGVVTGVAAGTAAISYTVAGGSVTTIVTVNSLPNAGTITGTPSVCVDNTTTLSNAASGGVWSSGNTSIATVGSTGIVSGISSGLATISYTVTNGCGSAAAIRMVTVNSLATPGIQTGIAQVAVGATVTLSDAHLSVSSPSQIAGDLAFASANYNDGIVTEWGGIPVSFTNMAVKKAPSTDVVACGSIAPGYFTGKIALIYRGSCEFSYKALEAQNAGAVACIIINNVPGVSDMGSGTYGTSVTIPVYMITTVDGNKIAASLAAGDTVLMSVNYGSGGGVWNSLAPSLATVNTTGVVTGVDTGMATIHYTVTNGCGSLSSATNMVVVSPAAISGTASLCVSSTTSLTGTPTGGTWSSSAISIATVGSTGIVSGVSPGTAVVSYTYAGSTATVVVTVNTLPDAGTITGTASVCAGSTTTLGNATTGGVWSSGATSIATVGSTGIVTGASAGTATISYTVTNTCGSASVVSIVTVNPLPIAGTIAGTASLCAGSTASLSNTTSGGVWSSENTSIATVGSTGLVSGVSAGTATISYTVTNECGGVSAVREVTVNPLPAPAAITGLSVVNIGASITLSNATTGGVWSSSNTSTATVGSTGIVTGVAAGTVTISYTVTNGCGAVSATKVVTVNAAALETEITGTLAVCVGAATMLSNATPDGTWSSSTTAVAVVDEETGVVTGIAAGTATISYTLSGISVTAIVTVNATPGTISGTLSVCIGNTTSLSSSPSGGTWTSGNTSRATVDAGSGLVTGVSTGNVDITYTLAGGCRRKVTVTVTATPASITGALTVCAGSTTALSSATTGGTWSSTATGIATVDAGTGVVTGVSTGTATISYSNGSCARAVIVTVNAAAGANTGTASVCIGSSSSLSNATIGGTWSSSDAAIATVHASTGLVTGISTGVVNITYTATPGCFAITSFTVNATVAAITGTMTVCPGATTALSSATSGGAWSSSNTARATIDAGTGVVTGVSGGTVTISYVVSAGCSQTAVVTVNTSPAGISGTASVCEGATTALTCSPGGGTWSSSSAAATVGSTGIVTGVSAGTATITYTAGTGCAATREVTVNVTPSAITGSLGVCVGSTSSLSSTPSGGTWAVTFTSKATVGSTTGIISGIAVGTTPVTYTVGGCRTTATVSVVTSPAAIGGTLTLCVGSTTNLTSATTGGTWTSNNTAIATVVSGTGVVTGVATGTAIISYSNGSCETTAVVTVNASLAASTGSSTVCVGQSTDLNNASSGGTWSSSSTARATVNASTGLVAGVSAGTVSVSYRVGAACFSITEMTVNATLSSITGTATVCPGATTALSHAVTGGVWTSGIPARATIDAGTGVVTGVSAGTVYITYAVGGCFTTSIVTVSAAPGAVGGTASVCEGGTITLTCSPTGGTWSSVVPATASISSTGVVTGVLSGTATISYTRLGCAATRVVTVTAAPGAIGGTLSACIGTTTTLTSSPAGGTWNSSNPARFTVVAGTGVVTGVSAGTATVTYAMSATCRATAVVTINASAGAISGSLSVCETCTSTLSSATSGGTWSSSNTVAATIGAGTGVVSGVGIGTTTISYVAGGCSSSAVVTVIAAIPSSFGTPVVCVGQTNATMGNPVAGGTWSSSNTSLATIHATTGMLTGIALGNPNITYTTSPGIYTVTVATVSAAVANITGTAAICPGATVALSNATTGGTWSSTNTARATVDAGTGVVTGVAAGTVTISYTINVGCYKAITQTVNAAPNVTGANNVVNGASTSFGGSPGGGTWSSANPAIASVSGTGVVTGNSVAATTITYTLPATGCFGTRSINVVAARAGSPSGGVIDNAGVLKVFPNPTSGSITIDAPVSGTFIVYTIDGKEVAQYTIGATTVTASLPQHLAAGVYMCRFNGADGTSAIVRLVYER